MSLPLKIKEAIEASPELNEQLLASGMGLDWKKFNRTVFDFLARRINKKVSQRVYTFPVLLTDKLIIGKDQLQQLTTRHNVNNEIKLLEVLREQPRPHSWISGKTLHSYWNKGKAKETKLHVLLTFLEVPPMEWDDWKSSVIPASQKILTSKQNRKTNTHHDLIKNYFLGSYFLYYQKSDNSRILIKAPFIIEVDERGALHAKTLTEGHPYKSTLIELRDGILYIHCENQMFDEKENHIFNVGNETNPEVLFGVSNTISVKKKMAIGLRNLLVKQKNAITEATFIEKEIPFDLETRLNKEEQTILNYFLKQSVNIINSQHCCQLSALNTLIDSE